MTLEDWRALRRICMLNVDWFERFGASCWTCRSEVAACAENFT